MSIYTFIRMICRLDHLIGALALPVPGNRFERRMLRTQSLNLVLDEM